MRASMLRSAADSKKPSPSVDHTTMTDEVLETLSPDDYLAGVNRVLSARGVSMAYLHEGYEAGADGGTAEVVLVAANDQDKNPVFLCDCAECVEWMQLYACQLCLPSSPHRGPSDPAAHQGRHQAVFRRHLNPFRQACCGAVTGVTNPPASAGRKLVGASGVILLGFTTRRTTQPREFCPAWPPLARSPEARPDKRRP